TDALQHTFILQENVWRYIPMYTSISDNISHRNFLVLCYFWYMQIICTLAHRNNFFLNVQYLSLIVVFVFVYNPIIRLACILHTQANAEASKSQRYLQRYSETLSHLSTGTKGQIMLRSSAWKSLRSIFLVTAVDALHGRHHPQHMVCV